MRIYVTAFKSMDEHELRAAAETPIEASEMVTQKAASVRRATDAFMNLIIPNRKKTQLEAKREAKRTERMQARRRSSITSEDTTFSRVMALLKGSGTLKEGEDEDEEETVGLE